VIGVDISTQANSQRTESLPDVLMQTFTIMGQHLAAAELREADVVIRPAIGERSSIDFRGREAVIAEGERSARARVPEMLAGIANWNSSKKEGGSP
jgi:NTE family protein